MDNWAQVDNPDYREGAKDAFCVIVIGVMVLFLIVAIVYGIIHLRMIL